MTVAKTLLTRSAIAALAFTSYPALSEAADSVTLKPLHGLSFKAGTAHAVGYFRSEDGACRLVLTYSVDDSSGQEGAFTVTRHEEVLGSGKLSRYSISDQPYEFACQANAEAMIFKPLNRFAEVE